MPIVSGGNVRQPSGTPTEGAHLLAKYYHRQLKEKLPNTRGYLYAHRAGTWSTAQGAIHEGT